MKKTKYYSNYPDDIRMYDNDPRSPFFVDKHTHNNEHEHEHEDIDDVIASNFIPMKYILRRT